MSHSTVVAGNNAITLHGIITSTSTSGEHAGINCHVISDIYKLFSVTQYRVAEFQLLEDSTLVNNYRVVLKLVSKNSTVDTHEVLAMLDKTTSGVFKSI